MEEKLSEMTLADVKKDIAVYTDKGNSSIKDLFT